MNALELICRMGIKDKNVPESLSHIQFKMPYFNSTLNELKTKYLEMISSLLSTWTYDEIIEWDGEDEIVSEYSVETFFELDRNWEYEEEELREHTETVEDFILCLKEIAGFDVTNIEVDFEKGIVWIE